MFIAASGDTFRGLFSEGLSRMLVANDLGAFILVLANSLQHHDLRAALQPAIDSIYAGVGAAAQGSDDDRKVFALLASEGIARQQCWQHRQAGCWQLVYNTMRRLRPARLATRPFAGISQPFDQQQFNFNRPILQSELFWQGEWRGCHFKVFYNKFPFAPWHLLIAPNAAGGRPQWLDAHTHAIIWELVAAQQRALPGFGIGYNSLGAGASVNHLHLQGFLRSDPLPVEASRWRHHGGDEPYPLHCSLADSADDAWLLIERLQQSQQPFNLLYRPGRCYLLPRRPQGTVSARKWAQGIAWYESCGVFTVDDSALLEGLDAQQIAVELGKYAHHPR
jgi:hypothetical protein